MTEVSMYLYCTMFEAHAVNTAINIDRDRYCVSYYRQVIHSIDCEYYSSIAWMHDRTKNGVVVGCVW